MIPGGGGGQKPGQKPTLEVVRPPELSPERHSCWRLGPRSRSVGSSHSGVSRCHQNQEQ